MKKKMMKLAGVLAVGSMLWLGYSDINKRIANLEGVIPVQNSYCAVAFVYGTNTTALLKNGQLTALDSGTNISFRIDQMQVTFDDN